MTPRKPPACRSKDSGRTHSQTLLAERRARSRRNVVVLWSVITGTIVLCLVFAREMMDGDPTPSLVADSPSGSIGSESVAAMTTSPKTELKLDEIPQLDSEVERLKREVERLKREAARKDDSKANPMPKPKAVRKKNDMAATGRRIVKALPDVREENLFSRLKGAQMLEDQARRNVDSIRLRPWRGVNRSALATAKAMLRLYEDGTRKARRAYESYVQDRRRKAKALELAANLPINGSKKNKPILEWTHVRVVALRDSIWALKCGYLNYMAIVRSTGGTTARQFTEDEEDAMRLADSCAALASEAFELSALRRSRPRPRALRRTADACLALYNRCADYCSVERRSVDSPAATHVAAIKKQADARAREDAEREAAKGRWNGRKLTNMLRSIAYIRDKRQRKKVTDLVWAADKLKTSATSGPEFERYTAACEKALFLFTRLRPPKDGRKRTVYDF